MYTRNPSRHLHATQPWTIRHRIDWQRWQAVVFESDDWGACENAPDDATGRQVGALWSEFYGGTRTAGGTLEAPADLDRIFRTLEQHRGADGQPVLFTPFICAGNPDFDAIRQNNFTRFVWLGIDRGVPRGWERGDIAGKWREGVKRGVFAPEFHGFLHHTSPKAWMRLLNTTSPEGELARRLFDLRVYCQGRHVPEYEGMNVREQNAFVKDGIAAFVQATGCRPAASVTSDAFPVTETIWALNGIRIVCLKNCKMNTGEVVVYHTKPWNNQDAYAPIGAYDEMNDVIFLTRNAWFEKQTADETYPVVLRRWAEGEPAVISTHRSNYVSMNPKHDDAGYAKLDDLLGRLAARGARFLSTAEIGDLYRQGWSLRSDGAVKILRKWADDAEPIRLPAGVTSATALPSGRSFTVGSDGTVEIPPGDYVVA